VEGNKEAGPQQLLPLIAFQVFSTVAPLACCTDQKPKIDFKQESKEKTVPLVQQTVQCISC